MNIFYRTSSMWIAGICALCTFSIAQTSKITKVVAQGDTLPSGKILRDFGWFSFNNQEDVAFLHNDSTFSSTLYRRAQGKTSVVIAQGDTVPGIGALDRLFSSNTLSMNDQGAIAFTTQLVLAQGGLQSGLFLATPQGISKIFRDGDAAPGGTVSGLSGRFRLLNNSGAIAFEGFYSNPLRKVLLLSSQGAVKEVAVSGNTTPIGGVYKFTYMYTLDINDNGQVLFVSDVQADSAVKTGIFIANGQSVSKVVSTDDTAPNGQKFNFLDPVGSLNNKGDVLFTGDACPTVPQCIHGVFLASGGAISLVAKTGDPAPGGGTFTSVSYPLINDKKQMVFQSGVDKGGGNTVNGIFTVVDGAMQKVIEAGDPSPIGGTVSSIAGPVVLTQDGAVGFYCKMTGGPSSSGIFLWNGGPQLGLSKDKIEFTDVTPGKTARSEMEITNTGGKTLRVEQITASPNPPFGLDQLPQLPLSLESDQKATFVVTYQPSSAGGKLTPSAHVLDNGSLTITTNAPGSPAVVPIVPPVTYGLTPDGVAVDPTNPYVDEGGAFHSKFADLSVSGTGLDLVNTVAFDPPDNIEVTRVQATSTRVDFDMIVYQDALKLGERDLILKTSDGKEINITKLIGKKFIITHITTQFNQAVDQAAVSTQGYHDKLVSNKKGVLRVQFQDPAQYNQIFNGRLDVQGVGTVLSPLVHAPQASYSETDIVNGRDYLTMPIAQPLAAGKRTFKFVMTRLGDGRVIWSPLINREVLKSLSVDFIAVSYRLRRPDGTVLNPLPDADAARALNLLRLAYPLSGDQLHYIFLGTQDIPANIAAMTESKHLPDGTAVTTFTPEGVEHAAELLSRLGFHANLKRKAAGKDDVNMVIGFFPEYIFYADTNKDGITDRPIAGATSAFLQISYQAPESGDDVQGIMAHEIGHNFQGSLSLLNQLKGLTGFGDEYEGGIFDCNLNPPVSDAKDFQGKTPCSGSPFIDGSTGDKHGTFTDQTAFNPEILKPMLTYRGASVRVTNYNFMSSDIGASRMWVQPSAYDKLLKTLLPLSAVQPKSIAAWQGAAGNAIRVRGVVFANDQASFDDCIVSSDAERSPEATGPYTIELQNQSGLVLAAHPFDVSFVELSEPPHASDHSFFNIMMDDPAGASKIVLKKNGATLATRTISANAPVIDRATAGDAGNGWMQLNWSAHDADNDSLRYTVLYSTGGNDWLPVETDITGTSYTWDTGGYPGSANAKIAIIASDGINTGEIEIPLSAGVGKKKPTVKLTSPAKDTAFASITSLVLTASAYDPEDGTLPDSAFAFSSSIDGFLGKGSPLYVRKLSAGTHTIRVAIADKDGNIATDSVRLSIQTPLSVGKPVAQLPSDFSLSQNYPNPFNPSTNIQFELPAASHVTIKIFSIHGQEVRTLTDDEYAAGRYQLQWNGRDNTGGMLSSGMYFIRIRAGSFMTVRKAVLLK